LSAAASRLESPTSLLGRKATVATALGLAPLRSEGVSFVLICGVRHDILTLPGFDIGLSINLSATQPSAWVFPA
jgi:hypothetical protein